MEKEQFDKLLEEARAEMQLNSLNEEIENQLEKKEGTMEIKDTKIETEIQDLTMDPNGKTETKTEVENPGVNEVVSDAKADIQKDAEDVTPVIVEEICPVTQTETVEEIKEEPSKEVVDEMTSDETKTDVEAVSDKNEVVQDSLADIKKEADDVTPVVVEEVDEGLFDLIGLHEFLFEGDESEIDELLESELDENQIEAINCVLSDEFIQFYEDLMEVIGEDEELLESEEILVEENWLKRKWNNVKHNWNRTSTGKKAALLGAGGSALATAAHGVGKVASDTTKAVLGGVGSTLAGVAAPAALLTAGTYLGGKAIKNAVQKNRENTERAIKNSEGKTKTGSEVRADLEKAKTEKERLEKEKEYDFKNRKENTKQAVNRIKAKHIDSVLEKKRDLAIAKAKNSGSAADEQALAAAKAGLKEAKLKRKYDIKAEKYKNKILDKNAKLEARKELNAEKRAGETEVEKPETNETKSEVKTSETENQKSEKPLIKESVETNLTDEVLEVEPAAVDAAEELDTRIDDTTVAPTETEEKISQEVEEVKEKLEPPAIDIELAEAFKAIHEALNGAEAMESTEATPELGNTEDEEKEMKDETLVDKDEVSPITSVEKSDDVPSGEIKETDLEAPVTEGVDYWREEPEEKEFNVDATIDSPDGAEIGTKENEKEIEKEVDEQDLEKEDAEGQKEDKDAIGDVQITESEENTDESEKEAEVEEPKEDSKKESTEEDKEESEEKSEEDEDKEESKDEKEEDTKETEKDDEEKVEIEVNEAGIIVKADEFVLTEAKSEVIKQSLMANGWSMSQRGRYDEELMTAKALGMIKSTLGLTIATCLSAISLVGLPVAYATAIAETVRRNNNLERINSDSYQELVSAVKADPKCQEILKKIKAELCEAKPDKKDLKALKADFFKAVSAAKEEYKSKLKEFVMEFDKENVLFEDDFDATDYIGFDGQLAEETNYSSLREAFLLEADYFETPSVSTVTADEKEKKLICQLAMLVAKESNDPIFDELTTACVRMKDLKAAIMTKYEGIAREKAEEIKESLRK